MKQAGQLPQSVAIVDSVIVRAQGGGEEAGRTPVDRRKTGTKLTLTVGRDGAQSATPVAGANASDRTQLLPTVVNFRRSAVRRSCHKQLRDEVMADAVHDCVTISALPRSFSIEPKIRRRKKGTAAILVASAG